MKSVKPGRGPSMLSGVVGIFMVGFGILWTVLASQASLIMAIFGILWTGIAIVTVIYNFKNATSKNRYSQFDITDENEEPDPLNQRFGNYDFNSDQSSNKIDNDYCPYCGNPVDDNYKYCNKCGRELP